MKEFGKKQIIVVALVIMIGIAGYINWTIKRNEDAVPTTAGEYEYDINDYAYYDDEGEDMNLVSETDDGQTVSQANIKAEGGNTYFSLARVEKQKARSEALDIHKELLNNENSSEDAKSKAEADIAQLASNAELEVVIENIIKAKGFAEAVCYLNEDNARIVVKSEGLVPAQVAQIKDIVMDNMEIAADKIKIVEIY